MIKTASQGVVEGSVGTVAGVQHAPDGAGVGTHGDGCGAAVGVLCAPPEVASELQRLFLQMAGKLYALESDPQLPHLQIRDVHGFMVLPGQGSQARTRSTVFYCSLPVSAAGSSTSTPRATHTASKHSMAQSLLSSSMPAERSSEPTAMRRAPAAATQWSSSEDQRGRRSIDLSSGSTAAPLQLNGAAPWLATPAERRACSKAWSAHFQPLVREISHLLTCVPGALPFEELGGWDQRTYCKTLAGLVGFFEHHACWATLAALLRHAGQHGVRLCYQGERMSEPVAPAALQALLQGAKHEDISVMYLPDEEQLRAQRQQLGALAAEVDQRRLPAAAEAEEFDGLYRTAQNYISLPPSLRTSITGELATSLRGIKGEGDCGAAEDDAGEGQEPESDDDLASEFSNWRHQWLTRGFTGTLDKIATGTPTAAPQSPKACTGLLSGQLLDSAGSSLRPKLSTATTLASGLQIMPLMSSRSLSAAVSCTEAHHVSTSREVLMVLLACMAVAVYAMLL